MTFSHRLQRRRQQKHVRSEPCNDHLFGDFGSGVSLYYCQFQSCNSTNCYIHGKFAVFRGFDSGSCNCSDLSHCAVEVENAQTLLEMVRRKGRDYQMVTVWSIIKRFIFGWLLTGVLLVIVSCVKYKEFIITAFTNNMWAWLNAVMPIIIIILGIGYMIKSLFR